MQLNIAMHIYYIYIIYMYIYVCVFNEYVL